MHMNAQRTVRITVNLTPALTAQLDRYAEENRWTRSTAAAVLIERGLPGEAEPSADRAARTAGPSSQDPAQADCPHPAARIHRGLCGACGTHVG
jgi:hypothetical protein